MKIIQQKEYHKCKLLWKLSIEQHQPSLYSLSHVSVTLKTLRKCTNNRECCNRSCIHCCITTELHIGLQEAMEKCGPTGLDPEPMVALHTRVAVLSRFAIEL